jgi:hypothetical protein
VVAVTEAQGGLFDVPELAADPVAGRAEAGLQAALAKAAAQGVVIDLDAGLVAGALICARALDRAEGIPNPKDRAYAVTALMPPFQKALHGLRLPAEVGPLTDPPAPSPAGGGDGTPSWLRDLGTAR